MKKKEKIMLMQAPPGGEPVYMDAPKRTWRTRTKTKRPKEYKHPITRSLHGQNLKVVFRMVDEDHYETSEYWTSLNGASLMAQGFVPAEDYKKDNKHIFTNVYVKFEGFTMRPCMRMDRDGKLREVETLETASTLYDYFRSTTEADFMESMKAKTVGSLGNKRLILLIILGVGVVAAGWLVSH